jgi:hypothetical protein
VLAVNDVLENAPAGLRDLLREVQTLAAQRFALHLLRLLKNAFEDLKNVKSQELFRRLVVFD